MVSLFADRIRFIEEVLPIQVVANQPFEVALFLGLVYLIKKSREANLPKAKFQNYLLLLNTPSSKVLTSFICSVNSKEVSSELSDPLLSQHLELSVLPLKLLIFEDFPSESFVESFCKAFEVNVLLIENNSFTYRYGQGQNCIRLLKNGDDFYVACEKESLVKRLIDLVENIEDFSERRKIKIKEIIKAHQLDSAEKCKHKVGTYKTLCGKTHCVECLKAAFNGNTWKSARCLCGSNVSAKNLNEVFKF